MGITLLPRSAVAIEASRAPVRVVPLAQPATRTLCWLWPARERRASLFDGIAQVLRASVEAGARAADASATEPPPA